MRNWRIDEALRQCEVYSETDYADEEVQSLLARSLLILICGKFEEGLRSIVLARCTTVRDKAVHSYIESYTSTILRSLKLQDVKRVLGRFGSGCKDSFELRLRGDEEARVAYSSLVAARHVAAHGGDVTVTLRDVALYYGRAHAVLDYFGEALDGGDSAEDTGGGRTS